MTTINPTSTFGLGLIPFTGGAAGLTPDALLTYCQTRLNGIDTQIQSAFAAQQHANDVQGRINDALGRINQNAPYGTDINDNRNGGPIHDNVDIIRQLDWAAHVAGVNTPEGQKLIGIRNEVIGRITASPADADKMAYWIDHPDPNMGSVWQQMDGAPNQLGNGHANDAAVMKWLNVQPAKNGLVAKEEIQGWAKELQGVQSEISSGSELGMIKLQSLMSQRQSAVQISTQMVQALGEQLNKIAANIGH